MKYIHGTEDFTLDKDSAVTLGKFDGVHMGHQKLISIVEEKAKQNNILAAAFTFDRIPLSICPQRQQHFITTNSERRAFMESLGINALIEYPFTEKLMNTDAGEFIEDIIIRKLRAKVVVVGTDYHFGKGRSGDADMLVKCGPEYGFETIVVEKEKYQDKEISSTYVREELVLGHMETVNVLMGRPYSIEGIVCPGNQFGRKIKIPTMNIYPQELESALKADSRVREALAYGYTAAAGTQIGLKIAGDFASADEVRRLCMEVLPGYQMPMRIELLPELAKNGSGKIKRGGHYA